MKELLGLPFVLLAFSSLGCGKSPAEQFADSYCAEIAKCCGEAGLPADGKMCHEWMTFATMGGSYNGSAGDACLAEMRAQVSAGIFCSSLSDSQACDQVFESGSSGNKKPGESCDFDSDCALSNEGEVVCASAYVNDAFIDKCQIQIPGKAGDTPCIGTQDGDWFMSANNDTDVAPRGYVCDVKDGVRCEEGVCTAMAAIGERCSFSSDCVRTAYCDYAQSQCVARIPEGGTCSGGSSDECLEDFYCSSSEQCTAKLPNGAACTSNSSCQSGSCSNGACDGGGDFGLMLLCGS
jgi:hypothetical protein